MPQKTSSLYILGRPFSPLYGLLMKVRETLYNKGFKKRHKLKVPVISVGNLTMGGTGKTPFVGYLAAMLQEKGFKPAIISRGYGGAAGNKFNVVSDGKQIFMDAASAGDEPYLLAKKLPTIPVLTGIVRILPCRHAVDVLGCNVLILDDGFQHLSVQRDLDIVLFSGASLAGNSRVFPGGDLREPVSALKRGDVFVLTGVTDTIHDRCTQFKKLLQKRFPGKPVFFTTYQPDGIINLVTGNSEDISTLPHPLFAFCGIGQPESFRRTLTENNISISGFLPLKDHQTYTPLLQKKISRQASQSNSIGLITTEKDLTKLSPDTFKLPCAGLKMQVGLESDFIAFLNEEIETLNGSLKK